MITKGALERQRHRRGYESTDSAREAIFRFVSGIKLDRPPRVLVPAYFGWSPNEGSGVMDPLLKAGADVFLIRVDRELHVDMEHFQDLLRRKNPDVVMPIHWFGWHDPCLTSMVMASREAGALVLEDEAHSMLSSLLFSPEGPRGDASAVSLHKTLPVPNGGALIDRRSAAHAAYRPAAGGSHELEYDLPAIARARTRNARVILAQLQEHCPEAKPLRTEIPRDVVPLNVPVLVAPEKRQRVYSEMNRSGIGVVSLYHILGHGIDEESQPDSFWLSSRLINLPCHQDTDEHEIPDMVAALRTVLVD